MENLKPVDILNADTVNATLARNLRRVVAWSALVTVTATAAGQTVTAKHDHGLKLDPSLSVLAVQPWQDSRWWMSESDRRLWSDKLFAFSVSVPGRYTVAVGRL